MPFWEARFKGLELLGIKAGSYYLGFGSHQNTVPKSGKETNVIKLRSEGTRCRSGNDAHYPPSLVVIAVFHYTGNPGLVLAAVAVVTWPASPIPPKATP